MVLGDNSSSRRTRALLQVPLDPRPSKPPARTEVSAAPSADMRFSKPGRSSKVGVRLQYGGEHLVEATDLMIRVL
jgi:hypothetical protein